MIFGSVCSGIEAASVAWMPLGWKAAWFSEIEKFPKAVLKHHYPDTPDLGDMTAPDFIDRARERGPINLLVGGCPCQSFSVAGLRGGLKDKRGGLTLRFVEIIHALKPTWIVYENVPGILSDKTNAFGCLLAGLSGASSELSPPLSGWSGAGVVSGPEYGLAWRVLDAKHFGVPQRRRRVFVVGYLGDWRRPSQVLFEPESMLGDNPTVRKTGTGVAADVGFCVTARGGSGRLDPTMETLIPHVITPDGNGKESQISPTVDAGAKDGPRRNQGGGNITHTLRGEGFDASEDGTGRGIPLVPVAWSERTRDGGSVIEVESGGVMPALRTGSNRQQGVLVPLYSDGKIVPREEIP